MKRIILPSLLIIFLVGCSIQSEISNFEECVSAGNPIMESYPQQCKDPITGNVFTEEIEDKKICKDLCGDNECQEIVCMGSECPCTESKSSCPQDCN